MLSILGAVLAFIGAVSAQATSTQDSPFFPSATGGLNPAPTQTPDGTVTLVGIPGLLPTSTVQCWIQTTLRGSPASVPVDPTNAPGSGAECWLVYPSGSLVIEVPTTLADSGVTTTTTTVGLPTGSPSAVALGASSSGTQASKLLIIAYVLGSLAVAGGVGVLLLWLRKRKRHNQTHNSRARRWIEAKGSWLPGEKPRGERFELGAGVRRPIPEPTPHVTNVASAV